MAMPVGRGSSSPYQSRTQLVRRAKVAVPDSQARVIAARPGSEPEGTGAAAVPTPQLWGVTVDGYRNEGCYHATAKGNSPRRST